MGAHGGEVRRTRWAGCTLCNRYYWYCCGYSRTVAVTYLPEEVVGLPEAHALGCQRIPDSIPPGMVCVPICALPTVPQCCGPTPACHVALWLPGRCRAARCMTHAMLHAVNNISSHFKCGIMLAAGCHAACCTLDCTWHDSEIICHKYAVGAVGQST